jgi:acyl carrier protein
VTTPDEVRAAVAGQLNSLAAREGAEQIGPHEHLLEAAGLDSVTFLAALVWIEDHYRIVIPDEELGSDQFTTIAGLSDYVYARLTGHR